MKIEIHFEISIKREPRESAVAKETTITAESFSRLRRIVERQSGKVCAYCGNIDKKGHIDHVIPLSRGGDDSLENLVWACRRCNLSKGSKTVGEWKRSSINLNELLEDVESDADTILGELNLLPQTSDPDTVTYFLKEIMRGQSLAHSFWTGNGNPLTRTETDLLKQGLENLKIIEPINPDSQSQGYRLTANGAQDIASILERMGIDE